MCVHQRKRRREGEWGRESDSNQNKKGNNNNEKKNEEEILVNNIFVADLIGCMWDCMRRQQVNKLHSRRSINSNIISFVWLVHIHVARLFDAFSGVLSLAPGPREHPTLCRRRSRHRIKFFRRRYLSLDFVGRATPCHAVACVRHRIVSVCFMFCFFFGCLLTEGPSDTEWGRARKRERENYF